MNKKSISISELDSNEKKRLDYVITIDKIHSNESLGIEYEYVNCDFLLGNKGTITFFNTTFRNCNFIGLDSSQSYEGDYTGVLHFRACSNISKITFRKTFNEIRLEKSSISDLNDFSEIDKYIIDDSKINNFVIKGTCSTLNIKQSKLSSDSSKKGLWKKEISTKFHCETANFNRARINTYFLLSKCEDPKTLDLSNATIIDDWSKLRKKYSGINLYIVVIFTFLFFIPMFTKSFFFIDNKRG